MATSAETYAAALKPYLSAGWYSDMAKTNPFWSQMIPYDKTQFDPKFSIDLMQYYNNKMGLGLTDAQIAAGIQNFGTRHQQQFGTGVTSESNPVAVGAESILRALELAGKDAGAFWSVASQDLGKGQAMADDIYRYTMAQGAKEYTANQDDDSSFFDKAVRIAIPAVASLVNPAFGALAGGLSSYAQGADFEDALKSAGLSYLGGQAISGLSGGFDGLFGDAAGSAAGGAADFFGEGTAGAVADYGTAAGTATTAATGGSMSWLDDIADWWSGDDILSQWTDVASDAGSSFGNYDWPSLGLGETGILADGGGYTGLSGTIDGLGTLTDAGMLIPAAGGAAVSLSSLSPSIWSNIIDKAVADPLGTAGKLAKTLGIFKEDGSINPSLVSGLLSVGGGILTGNAATDAAKTAANAQLEAARIAADAAKFKPVGVTTRFGQSQFTKDAQGNVTDAGYTMPNDIRAMQDSLLGAAPGMLSQFTGSQAATAPMGDAAQRMMQLGNGYLATDPQAQAQKYYDDQQAIMATGRARDQAGALTGEFNRGTYGLATGATGMMGAANPRLEAMYNAQRQQDLQASANATQGGMDYAKFGSTMTGLGGDMLKSMYGTQTAAYNPYATAMTGAQNIEGLGQNALDLSVNMGKVASPAQSGQLLGQGMLGAANTMQQANQYSPWGTALMSAGNALNTMQQPQQQQTSGYMFNPFTGVRL